MISDVSVDIRLYKVHISAILMSLTFFNFVVEPEGFNVVLAGRIIFELLQYSKISDHYATYNKLLHFTKDMMITVFLFANDVLTNT